MKKIIAIGLSVVCLNVYAQNQDDIFRYSQSGLVGSARTLGLGGAWGAAGADLGAASINPAGLGLYRRNELMGAISITSNLSKTDFNGNLMSDSRTRFNIPNVGFVFNFTDQNMGKQQTKGVVGGSFAFGINRLNDFTSRVNYGGLVNNATVGDYLASQANGNDSSFFFSKEYDNELYAQAWRVRLIDNDNGGSNYSSIQSLRNDTAYTMTQSQFSQTRGRVNEWYLSGGLNVGNFLYLGGSFVIHDVRLFSESQFRETMKTTSVVNNPYKSTYITQDFETRGAGVGAKFGLILRPFDFIRIGAAYHTPVRLNLTDYYENQLSMTYTDGNVYTEPSEKEEAMYKYQIVTPQKIHANTAIIVGKIMVIAADYERVDYSKGRLQAVDALTDFANANNLNKSKYGVGQNVKLGMEVNAGYTRIRAGYGLIGNPFADKSLNSSDFQKHVLSLGFGWIYDNEFFFDIAVNDRIGKDFLTPFEGNPIVAENMSHKLNFVVSAGHRF
ncbi:MAG: hypothetical protein KA981_09435 [Bacteroidia bacterium]|jgi:hypothetical protein|nr:hypothetical protein [Bacteroidia bacterium]